MYKYLAKLEPIFTCPNAHEQDKIRKRPLIEPEQVIGMIWFVDALRVVSAGTLQCTVRTEREKGPLRPVTLDKVGDRPGQIVNRALDTDRISNGNRGAVAF